MNKVKITTDIIYNDNVSKDITLCHISDIHFSINTKEKDLYKIKSSIFRLQPDYVLITGDTIDYPTITKNKTKINELLSFLTDISKKYKIFISLGNHDIITDDDYKFFNKINELYNIYVLDNITYNDDVISITGLTLPNSYYYNLSNDESVDVLYEYLSKYNDLINKVPKNLPKILLIHSPIKLTEDKILNKLKNYDLILSGHTHNGMVPDILNFLFKGNTGIISPSKKLLPSLAKGKIEKNINNKKITIIINGAITKLSYHSGIFSKFNFVYNKSINEIIIRKKRGIKYE